jgi:hypothetical protein
MENKKHPKGDQNDQFLQNLKYCNKFCRASHQKSHAQNGDIKWRIGYQKINKIKPFTIEYHLLKHPEKQGAHTYDK